LLAPKAKLCVVVEFQCGARSENLLLDLGLICGTTGSDELNVVTGNGVTQEACANAISTVAKPQERTTDSASVFQK
jgi:hypothetical protein